MRKIEIREGQTYWTAGAWLRGPMRWEKTHWTDGLGKWTEAGLPYTGDRRLELLASVTEIRSDMQPFTCHCAECGHEFAPFFLPIPITRMPKDYACPRGCTGKVYVGRAPENRGG